MEIENFLGLVYGIETYVRRVPFGAQTRCFCGGLRGVMLTNADFEYDVSLA